MGAEVFETAHHSDSRAPGVVIATGGYPGNLDMRREHSRKPTVDRTLGVASNVGEGIRLGPLSAGARLDHNANDTGFYVPVSVYSDEAGPAGTVGTLHARSPQTWLHCGRQGRKQIHQRGGVLPCVDPWHVRRRCDPGLPDRRRGSREEDGIGVILPGLARSLRRYEKAGYLFSGQTLAELASKIGVDPNGLERSVARATTASRQPASMRISGKGSSRVQHVQGRPDTYTKRLSWTYRARALLRCQADAG